MPRLVGFSRFDALLEEQIDEKISRRILSGDQGMVVWWSIGAGVRMSLARDGGLGHVRAGVEVASHLRRSAWQRHEPLDRHNRQAAWGGLFLKTCEVA